MKLNSYTVSTVQLEAQAGQDEPRLSSVCLIRGSPWTPFLTCRYPHLRPTPDPPAPPPRTPSPVDLQVLHQLTQSSHLPHSLCMQALQSKNISAKLRKYQCL